MDYAIYYIKSFLLLGISYAIFAIPFCRVFSKITHDVEKLNHIAEKHYNILSVAWNKFKGWVVLWAFFLFLYFVYTIARTHNLEINILTRVILSIYLPLVFFNAWMLVVAGCIFWAPVFTSWTWRSLVASLQSVIMITLFNRIINRVLPYDWTHIIVMNYGRRLGLELWSFYSFPPCLLIALLSILWYFKKNERWINLNY